MDKKSWTVWLGVLALAGLAAGGRDTQRSQAIQPTGPSFEQARFGDPVGEDEDEDSDEAPDGPSRATACCTPGGCLDAVEPEDCRELGGEPFGLCASCDSVTCPNPGCIGATGGCFQAHDTPGCDFLYCCDQICDNQPHCCTAAWDETCANARCIASSDESPCCGPAGACGSTSSSICSGSGGESLGACQGDADGDGVDEACVCTPGSNL